MIFLANGSNRSLLQQRVRLTSCSPLQFVWSAADNYFLIFTLTVVSTCPLPASPVAEIDPFTTVTATQDIYANLEPAKGDIDLGSRYGITFPALSSGSTYTVEVRTNSGGSGIVVEAWQALITFDSDHVRAIDGTCTIGADWNSPFDCSTNEPINEVEMVGVAVSGGPSGTRLHVGSVDFSILSVVALSQISGTVKAMVRSDSADTSGDPESPMLSGDAFWNLNGHTSARRRSLLEAADISEQVRALSKHHSLDWDDAGRGSCSAFGISASDELLQPVCVDYLQWYLRESTLSIAVRGY